MHCDVIITYCWNRVGYNILRSLSSHGLRVIVADTSTKNICSLSKYNSGYFIYPDPFTEEDAFIECLVNKINELQPKVLLPTHDESVVIMRNRHRFPHDLVIPYVHERLLLEMADKAESSQKAQQAGVPIPELYHHVEDVHSYPVVFKTAIGNSAKSVFFPESKEELEKLIDAHQGRKTMIEEFIGGTDYSVDCVRWNGFWQSSVYQALVTKTKGGGTTTQRIIVDMPELEMYAKRLLDYVDYQGVCGLDFRYDNNTGRVAYIETNARFTGGLATPIKAGFDIPWVLYKLSTEGKYEEPILGDIITLVGRAMTLNLSKAEMKQVFSYKGFDGFDDFYMDDKKAILGEMIYYFEKLIKNGKLNP